MIVLGRIRIWVLRKQQIQTKKEEAENCILDLLVGRNIFTDRSLTPEP